MTTYVLIHGAYQGGWIWQPVARRLIAGGHIVYSPSLDGCAERAGSLRTGITTESHAAEVAQLLHYEDLTDVTLVGTSSGGMVTCRVAELMPERVGRVVFVDALALHDGERISDFVTRSAGTTTDVATGPTAQDMETRLFADLEPELRTWAVSRVTLHPVAAMTDPVQLERFWSESWSAQVVYCRQSVNPPEAHQRRTADVLDASWHELDTGHYPMLSMPDELSQILLAGPTG